MAPKLRSSKPTTLTSAGTRRPTSLRPRITAMAVSSLPAKIAVTSPRRPKVRPALTDSSKSSSGTMIGSGAVTPRSLSASRHPLVRVLSVGPSGRPTWNTVRWPRSSRCMVIQRPPSLSALMTWYSPSPKLPPTTTIGISLGMYSSAAIPARSYS